jgi:diaminopimelate epimerase
MLKGHGTGNDFVIVPDYDGALELRPAQVRLLCDRHRGIGGDGVLRVVRVAADREAAALAALDPAAAGAQWFMDYRNADGSTAEMCGNGIRVFAQYLRDAGLVGDTFEVLTRGGAHALSAAGEPGEWIVAMGRADRLPFIPAVTARGGPAQSALSVLQLPNPHVVVRVTDEAALAALDLTVAPSVSPPLPHGQNVEFVAITGPRSLSMRVHERGVGRRCRAGRASARRRWPPLTTSLDARRRRQAQSWARRPSRSSGRSLCPGASARSNCEPMVMCCCTGRPSSWPR